MLEIKWNFDLRSLISQKFPPAASLVNNNTGFIKDSKFCQASPALFQRFSSSPALFSPALFKSPEETMVHSFQHFCKSFL